jgi:DNA-binding LacI/PurR family transcriptional regulator
MKMLVTIKDVAREAGVSMATVSLVMRSSPRIRPETAAKVREAADRLGYTPSPMVSALMARIRSARPNHDHTTLAVLGWVPPTEPAAHSWFQRDIAAGIKARSEKLGFNLQYFSADGRSTSLARISQVLRNTGVPGAIIPPLPRKLASIDFDFTHLSAVAVGYSLLSPALHRVCPDQYQGMSEMHAKLSALGYRRIGLCIDRDTDTRVMHKWMAVQLWHNRCVAGDDAVPPHLCDTFEKPAIERWLKRSRPDAIIAPTCRVLRTVRSLGYDVPGDLGFALTNHADRDEPCSGLDQRPQLLGENAVDAVVAQINRNERGVPAVPLITSVEGVWVAGATTRGVAPRTSTAEHSTSNTQ